MKRISLRSPAPLTVSLLACQQESAEPSGRSGTHKVLALLIAVVERPESRSCKGGINSVRLCTRMHQKIVLFFVVAESVACGPPRSSETEPAGESSEHRVHWSYDGESGPDHWAELSRDFAVCAEGTEQSPIDLAGASVVAGPALERRIGEPVITMEQRVEVMDLIDNGHTIQVTDDAPMAIDLDGAHYDLVQYHFHAPSEHTLGGEHAPLEVHYVHRSAQGNLAVLAALVVEGAHEPFLDPLLAALPSGPGDARHLEDLELDLEELHPLTEVYYRYRGSLTTPRCSEGVEWIVWGEPDEISTEQMAAITSHLHENNRPVQPLGERELVLVSSE